MIVTEGSANVSVPFYFVDDVGGTSPGEPTTGLLFSDIETGGSASYQRQGAARVDFTLQTLASASAAHADGGFILIDDAEMPGVYRCDIPDAAIASGVDFVIIYLRAASANNTITRPLKIDLTVIDLRETNGRVDVGAWLGTAATTSSTTNKPEVDVNSVSDDATAANNLELMYDTTGYTDPSAPASRSQVDNIGAASGGSVNIAATEDNTGGAIDPSSAAFVGSVQSGTFSSTEALDGVLHDIDDTANDIDIVYGFDVGGSRVATEVDFAGFVQGVNDEMKVKAYDHVGTDWEIIGTIDGQTGTSNVSLSAALLSKHTGTGAELGKIYIRIETDSTTPSNLSVDQLLVSAVNTGLSIGYEGGAVWLDTAASNTNTELFVDGTADNPVSTIAAVMTILTNLGTKIIHLLPGSSITLAANSDALEFIGMGYTIALGGQSIEGARFVNGTITGIGVATTTAPAFATCSIGAVTLPASTFFQCKMGAASGTFTAAAGNGEYLFADCVSGIPGAASPVFDFSPVTGATGINNRRWSGGATYTLDSNCTLSHEVLAGGGTTITTGGGDAEVRGTMRSLTVTLSAAETVQFVGIVGPIALSGTTTATVNLHGVSTSLANTTSAATVTDNTIKAADLATVDTVVDGIATEIGTAGAGLTDLGGMSAGMKAEVNAEVDKSIDTDTTTLPGQSAPSVTPTLRVMIAWLYKNFRNRKTQTATEWKLLADDESTVDSKATVSDDATTAIKQEIVSGP